MLIKIDNLNGNDNAQDPAMHNLRCCINILKIRIGMSDIWQIPRRSLHSYGNLYVTKSELQHRALEVKHVVFSGSLCDQISFSPSHGLTSAAIHKSKIYSRFTSIRQLMLANLKATPFRVLKCGNKYPEHHNIRCFQGSSITKITSLIRRRIALSIPSTVYFWSKILSTREWQWIIMSLSTQVSYGLEATAIEVQLHELCIGLQPSKGYIHNGAVSVLGLRHTGKTCRTVWNL